MFDGCSVGGSAQATTHRQSALPIAPFLRRILMLFEVEGSNAVSSHADVMKGVSPLDRSAEATAIKRLHIIVNPAAGRDRPMLSTFNTVFGSAGVEWDLSITKAFGDARRHARRVADARLVDAIAVYGGDGTVMEVASGLVGTDVPLMILPGGTGNSVAHDLNIPRDIAAACRLVFDGMGKLLPVDVGQLVRRSSAPASATTMSWSEEASYFLLHTAIGFLAEVARGADRSLKDRIGMLAYTLAGLEALRTPQVASYGLTIDGHDIVSEGLTVVVANSANLGAPGLRLERGIDMTDGFLDVILVQRANPQAALTLLGSIVRGEPLAEPIVHWRARELTVVADPAQPVEVDGELLDATTISARMLPGAIRVLVPHPATPADGQNSRSDEIEPYEINGGV
jgi:diacylglycerol kinase (ATP)